MKSDLWTSLSQAMCFTVFISSILIPFFYFALKAQKKQRARQEVELLEIKEVMIKAKPLPLEEAITLLRQVGISPTPSGLELPDVFWWIEDYSLLAKTLVTLIHWSRCHYHENGLSDIYANHRWLANKLVEIAQHYPKKALGLAGSLMSIPGVEGAVVISYYVKGGR